jgi:pimeloyl-ACP methyl ester carboxylesterase
VRRFCLLLCVVVLLAGFMPNLTAEAQGKVPRWEKAKKCEFDVPKGQTVTCGFLVVPEDRTDPKNKNTIKLYVAIFKAKTAKRAQDAIIYLEGGPGGYSLAAAGTSFSNAFAGFARTHDFIMFDQRGVGFSKPSLACPEETKVSYDNVTGRVPHAKAAERRLEALKACYDRLVAAGVNLSAYNSAQNAADVNDLRIVLGYKEFNLYGISYGTRLALTVMRDFPKGVRSVILDSTVPLQAELYPKIPANADRAFKVFFQGCLKDRPCNAAYPNLDKVFYDLVDKLNKKPITVTAKQPYTSKKFKVLVDGHMFINMLFNSLYSSQVIIYLPMIIWEASKGDYKLVEQVMAGSLVKQDFVSTGMYFSVQCAEEVSFNSQESLVAATKSFPKIASTFDMGYYYKVCQTWKVKPAPPVENQPVTSNIPTLVMAGQYDPITPPAYGHMAAKTIKGSYMFEFPGVGHGASVGDICPYRVAIAFFDNPKTRPDIGCVSTMTEPHFVTR